MPISSKSPLISLIIPCYNSENFITKTIDSVIRQSYKNWECIIIDDGSTDNTFEKIKNHSLDYPNIQIIKQENQGISLSRNKGLELALGEYIFFIDADDLISSDCLSSMVASIEKNPAIDIVVGKTATTNGQNYIVKGYLNHIDKDDCFFNEDKEILKQVVLNDTICTSHNKLFRKKFLVDNKIFFLKEILHEDELFFFETIYFCKTICFNQEITYYYNINNSESITKNITLQNIDSYLFILQYIYENYYLKTNNNKTKEVISFYIFDLKKVIITFLKKLKKEETNIAVKKIKRYFKTILPHRNYILTEKSIEKFYYRFYILSLLGPTIAERFLLNSAKSKMEKKKLKFYLFLSSILNYRILKETYKIKL